MCERLDRVSVKTDLGLCRDQKRLALMKLASLSEDHPLREKYKAWIDQLDSHLSGPGAPIRPLGQELDEPSCPSGSSPLAFRGKKGPGVLDERRRHESPSITKRRGEEIADHPPEAASIFDPSKKARLLSENQLLRGMLARFG
jgi:hypothetical protein